jgi:hypothetical protein
MFHVELSRLSSDLTALPGRHEAGVSLKTVMPGTEGAGRKPFYIDFLWHRKPRKYHGAGRLEDELLLLQRLPDIAGPDRDLVRIEVLEKRQCVFSRCIEKIPEFSHGHLRLFCKKRMDPQNHLFVVSC